MTAAVDFSGVPWTPPNPREVPEWRARIREYTTSRAGLQTLSAVINAGRATLLPQVPGTQAHTPGAIASQILARLEDRKLAESALYYVTEDMTSLALAAAATPPGEVLNQARLPAPSGLMLFAEPIGGYTQKVADTLQSSAIRPGPDADLTITTPIVAVSWTVWTPSDLVISDGPKGDVTPTWYFNAPEGLARIPPDWEGIWLTFYAPGEDHFAQLPPEAVVATGPDGNPMTAREIVETRKTHLSMLPPLAWDNESILGFDSTFDPDPPPDTTQQWTQVLYTAWQLITQTGKTTLADIEEAPRQRAGRRRDERAGITGPPGVRIVRVHSAHRPPREAADQDAEQSTGRRAPNWSCRWPVRPYRRNTCLNPRGHADGDCMHKEDIIPAHVKGPRDKPLRVRDTVHLWDQQPAPDNKEPQAET